MSGAVESTVADLIRAMKELFSACQLSPAENSFMKSVTTSASNVVLNCERVHKALMAIKNNINKEEDQDVIIHTQNETRIVEKTEKSVEKRELLRKKKRGNMKQVI